MIDYYQICKANHFFLIYRSFNCPINCASLINQPAWMHSLITYNAQRHVFTWRGPPSIPDKICYLYSLEVQAPRGTIKNL